MAESVWTRQYLKSMGAKDDEIDYQNGAVTYKNKPFQYTTPKADGKAYGSQQELSSAYKAYQSNEALDQYKNNINKPITPFSYDMNSIKADPLYTSALNSYTQDANRGTNTALSNLGRRGIGNSQSAVTAELSGQQNINDYANNQLAPQVIGQKYQQYLDQMSQQEKQNQSLLGLSGMYDQQNQQSFNNNLATNQDNRAAVDQKFNQGITEAGVTGYYDQYVNQKKQMQDNSAAWFNATPAERDRLAAQNKEIGASIGATQDAQGNWIYPKASQTLAGQGQAFNQNLATDQFNYGKEQDAADRNFKQQESNRTAQQFAQSLGLDYSRLNQSQQQFLDEMALKDRQLQSDTSFRDKQFEQSLTESERAAAQQAFKTVQTSGHVIPKLGLDANGISTQTGQYDVPDKDAFYSYVLSLGLPDNVADSIFLQYGQKDLVKK